MAAGEVSGGVRMRKNVPHSVLKQALDAIAFERETRLQHSFELAQELVSEYGEADLAERLFADLPDGCPWEVSAVLFDMLTYMTSENGAAIRQTLEGWLRAGDDLQKVQIAVNLEGIAFSDDPNETSQVLTRISELHPEVRERCDWIIRYLLS